MKRCPKCGKTYADEANFCPTDAARLVVIATDAIAAAPPTASNLVAGRFELGPSIGGSATGEVFRAVDAQSGTAVALKLVAPAVMAIPQVAQRIDRELKQLERVTHKGVAKVLGSGKHGDRAYVALELMEGARPLSELIAASGPLDPQRASELVVALGEALIEAAKVGVVHRDLAPENILVTAEAMRLVNFAIPTPGERAPGVPEYVAPESIEGKPVDQRSNIYSLGAIYYFLLTGEAPHTGEPAQVLAATLAGQVEAPSKKAGVPADVDALVLRALERNAAKRYLTLRQFLDEVERVARGPEGGLGSTAPFGRAGGTSSGPARTKELAQTLMGFGALPGGAPPAKTRQMDVQVPPEARREPVSAPVASLAPAVVVEPAAMAPLQAAPAEPWAGAAQAVQEAAPQVGAAAGSPWVRPPEPAAPVAAPVVAAVAAPVAAPVAAVAAKPAPPTVAAPRPAATGGASGKKKEEKPKGGKGKFRETMWFKKGELDAQAAEEAAATGDVNAPGKADSLPIDERYSDDGSLTHTDADKYSLKTGATSMMQAVGDGPSPSASVSERELVGEMKGGRNLILILIVVGILAAVGIAAVFVL